MRRLIRKITRRRTLKGIGAAMGAAALGCGDDGNGGATGSGGTTGGGGSSEGSGSTSSSGSSSSGSSGSGSESGSSDETGDPFGTDCGEMSDLSASELLAPIETIVVVMMENRSFDHYFGSLSLEEGAPVDGLTGAEANPDLRGNPIPVFPSDYFVVEEDPPHGWDSSREQWNMGANDGFVRAHQSDGARIGEVVMGYHTRAQLPTLYSLASNYVLCERWFASVMGPTQPNRFHMHLGHSAGLMSNPDLGDGPTGYPSIFDRLTDAKVDNVYYNSGIPFPLAYGRTDGIEPIANFFEAAAAGNLRPFVMIDPIFTAAGVIGNDDHPPADIRMGQAFLATIYEALAQSPQWDRCLLVITYDEHGGFYDHVSPPTTFDDVYPEFQQLGFRVPSLVIGPHVRRGCATSVVLDHVSVPATLTRKFGLEPLNNRCDMANDITSAIDPRYLKDPQPPISLAPMKIRVPRTLRLPPGQTTGHQIELTRMMDRGGYPRHLDRRGAADETMQTILHWGQRLGALQLIR